MNTAVFSFINKMLIVKYFRFLSEPTHQAVRMVGGGKLLEGLRF